jgi:hypothetical protein
MQMGKLPNPARSEQNGRVRHHRRKGWPFNPELTLSSVSLDLLPGFLAELDTVGTVHLGGDDPNLLLQRLVQVVQELELGFAFTSLDDGLGEGDGSLSTLGPVIRGHGVVGTVGQRVVLNQLQFSGRIGAATRRTRSRISE